MNPQILLAHESFVRALARSLLADENRADDVVQDTWLAALKSPPLAASKVSGGPGQVRGWLRRVVENFAKQEHRGSARRAKREKSAARREAIPSTEEIVAIEGARRKLVEAVLDLDEPVRSAIFMRFYANKPPRVIARELAVSVETVKGRIKRGLQQLRSRFGSGDGRGEWLRAAPFLVVARLPFREVAAASSVKSAAITAGGILMKTGTKVALVALILIGALGALSPLLPDWFRRSVGQPVAGSDIPRRQSSGTAMPATDEPKSGPEPSAQSRVVDTPIEPGRNIVVVDESGRGIPGALVYDGTREHVTGEEGRTVVATSSQRIKVSALGFIPTTHRLGVPEQAREATVTIRLARGTSFVGRLVQRNGSPVAGCALRVARGGTKWDLFHAEQQDAAWESINGSDVAVTYEYRVTTDDAGRFVVQGLGPGKHELSLNPYWVPAQAAMAFSFDPGQTPEQTFLVDAVWVAVWSVYAGETSRLISDRCLRSGLSAPEGLTLIGMINQGLVQAINRIAAEKVGRPFSRVAICRGPSEPQARLDSIGIGVAPAPLTEYEIRFVPLSALRPEDVFVLHADGCGGETACLEVDAKVAPVIWPGSSSSAHLEVCQPDRHEGDTYSWDDVPTGAWSIGTLDNVVKGTYRKARTIELAKDAVVKVDLRDEPESATGLRLSVSDSAGVPTNAFFIQVRGGGLAELRGDHWGPDSFLPLAVGSYKIALFRLSAVPCGVYEVNVTRDEPSSLALRLNPE